MDEHSSRPDRYDAPVDDTAAHCREGRHLRRGQTAEQGRPSRCLWTTPCVARGQISGGRRGGARRLPGTRSCGSPGTTDDAATIAFATKKKAFIEDTWRPRMGCARYPAGFHRPCMSSSHRSWQGRVHGTADASSAARSPCRCKAPALRSTFLDSWPTRTRSAIHVPAQRNKKREKID